MTSSSSFEAGGVGTLELDSAGRKLSEWRGGCQVGVNIIFGSLFVLCSLYSQHSEPVTAVRFMAARALLACLALLLAGVSHAARTYEFSPLFAPGPSGSPEEVLTQGDVRLVTLALNLARGAAVDRRAPRAKGSSLFRACRLLRRTLVVRSRASHARAARRAGVP